MTEPKLPTQTDEPAFNQALDALFAQIKEFLRENYGASPQTAMGFERLFLQRFQKFEEWKSKPTKTPK